MLFLGVSEVVICNKTGARGDPTQQYLTSLTTFLKLKKKKGGPILISVGSASYTAFKFPLKLCN